jgi:hypothetical protein
VIATRTLPDASGLAWKLIVGWWCPCSGPGIDVGHHASECGQRIQVQEWVATYPAWRVTAWQRSSAGADDAERVPFVRCRPLSADDPVPPAARRMQALIDGNPARLTYAKGWGRRLVPGAGDDGKGKFLPWPVESVALRVSGVCAVAWTRREGETAWSPDAAYAVWDGRIWPVNVTAVTALLKSLKESA